MKLFYNIKVVFPDSISEAMVLFSDRIKKIIKGCDNNIINEKTNQYQEIELLDGGGSYLVPGFIDIHIHGAAGFDTMDGTGEALTYIKDSLIKSGVTSFLATTMSMPVPRIRNALNIVRDQMKKETIGSPGARIIGCHLEGPFLNKAYKGAHLVEDIIPPDISFIEEYRDIIKILTLAPEIKGADELIVYMKENGIISSAAHTGAGYDEIIRAQKRGLSHITHLFNAMPGLHHRKPGIIGAALTTDMSVELIADFVHIHPAVLKLVLQAKELDKIILVTDQMRAGSLDEGIYDLGGQEVIVKNGSARLKNGRLAGSVLTLDRAVRNIREISDLDIHEIINMVSYNPAHLLGMDDEIGCIKVGNKADLVLLDDKLEVINVYRDGRRISK